MHRPDTLKDSRPASPCVDVPPCPPLSAQPHHPPKLDDPKWTEMDRKIRGRVKNPTPPERMTVVFYTHTPNSC